MTITVAEHRKRVRLANREASDAFIAVVEIGDADRFRAALGAVDYRSACWRQIWRRRDITVHPDFRDLFLSLWENHGDGLRSSIDNDLLLLDLLHRFLPPYAGPAVESLPR
jgi:hypothetical protein